LWLKYKIKYTEIIEITDGDIKLHFIYLMYLVARLSNFKGKYEFFNDTLVFTALMLPLLRAKDREKMPVDPDLLFDVDLIFTKNDLVNKLTKLQLRALVAKYNIGIVSNKTKIELANSLFPKIVDLKNRSRNKNRLFRIYDSPDCNGFIYLDNDFFISKMIEWQKTQSLHKIPKALH
jgi:hypothetical protein